MGINNKKTIIFDIDETLVENELYPENLEEIMGEIKLLKKYNYFFGICTNRPLEKFVKRIVKTYKINDFIICESGACIYKKILGFYNLKKKLDKNNINKILKNNLKEYKNYIKLNNKRISSATIKILNNKIKSDFVLKLKQNNNLKNYLIEENNFKIIIQNKNVDKIKTINYLYKCESVIFVTDYENKLSTPKKNVKIYSVGIDKNFNNKCHKIFNKSTLGVLEILKEEGNKYEKI